MAPTTAIGIDLGTTYSCVGIFENGRVNILSNDHGKRTTPSHVAFTYNGRYVGENAKTISNIDPANTVYDAKRLIGRRFNDPCVREDAKHWPFKVIDQNGRAAIELNIEYLGKKRRFYPEEISAMILERLKVQAEKYLGRPVKEAVITVPAYFTDAQRQATRDAGMIAGLNVLRIINEPTAAAIAYGFDRDRALSPKSNVLIYDLGGGTFDISVLTIHREEGTRDGCTIEVKGIGGDTHLGGEDFDTLLVEHVVKELKRKYQQDPTNNKRAMRRLRVACERAKLCLSEVNETTIDLDSFLPDFDLNETVSRAKFESLCLPLFEKTMDIVEDTLKTILLKKDQIDEIILVGGSTRIPMVQSMVKKFFNGKELIREILQDEAVAHGAVILAGQLSNAVSQSLVFKDVTPITLGLEDFTKVFDRIVERHTYIPCKVTCQRQANHLSPKVVRLKVYEGERGIAEDNHFLGDFYIHDLPQPSDGSLPLIDITFEIDQDGILSVSASETLERKSGSIRITRDGNRHSKAEIDAMISEAKHYREDDAKWAALANARNELETYVYLLKSKFYGDKFRLTTTEHRTIEEQIEEAEDWMDKNLQTAEKLDLHIRLTSMKKICQPIVGNI